MRGCTGYNQAVFVLRFRRETGKYSAVASFGLPRSIDSGPVAVDVCRCAEFEIDLGRVVFVLVNVGVGCEVACPDFEA